MTDNPDSSVNSLNGESVGSRIKTPRRRDVLKSSAALLSAGGLAGCTGDDTGANGDTTTDAADDSTDSSDDSSDDSADASGDDTHIAVISTPSGFGDKGFADLALQGLQAAQETHDFQLQRVDETDQSKYQTVQSQLASSESPNYDLIVGVGFYHKPGLEENAKQYPDQNWMIINDHVEQPNVAGYIWGNHHMCYQAGVLAGTMTTQELSHNGSSTDPSTAKVGFVGGAKGPFIKAFERAYRAGAQYVNEDVEVLVGYVGNFSDAQKGNQIATSQFDSGADIVMQAAAAAGHGVFPAAQDANRFAIGVDTDQSVTLPEYKDVIMGSAVKFIDKGTEQVATAVVNDDFESVQGLNVLGLPEDGVALVQGQTIGPKLPAVVDENLQETKQKIISGEITVPCTASGCKD